MLIRLLDDVPFRVHSPSTYICDLDTDLVLMYGGDRQWYWFNGTLLMGKCATLSAAAAWAYLWLTTEEELADAS